MHAALQEDEQTASQLALVFSDQQSRLSGRQQSPPRREVAQLRAHRDAQGVGSLDEQLPERLQRVPRRRRGGRSCRLFSAARTRCLVVLATPAHRVASVASGWQRQAHDMDRGLVLVGHDAHPARPSPSRMPGRHPAPGPRTAPWAPTSARAAASTPMCAARSAPEPPACAGPRRTVAMLPGDSGCCRKVTSTPCPSLKVTNRGSAPCDRRWSAHAVPCITWPPGTSTTRASQPAGASVAITATRRLVPSASAAGRAPADAARPRLRRRRQPAEPAVDHAIGDQFPGPDVLPLVSRRRRP